jgi:hypothetical protein
MIITMTMMRQMIINNDYDTDDQIDDTCNDNKDNYEDNNDVNDHTDNDDNETHTNKDNQHSYKTRILSNLVSG